MQRTRKYSFYEKPHSKKGKVSFSLGVTTIILLIISIAISFFTKGGSTFGNAAIGGISLVALLLAIYGFFVGMVSLRESEKNHFFGVLGAIGCGVMAVIWFTLFLRGVA